MSDAEAVERARDKVKAILAGLDPSAQSELLAGERAASELRDKQFQDSIRSRIDMVKDATTRSRYVLIVSAVLSSAMALVLYNFTLSWVHSIALDPDVVVAGKITTELQKMLLDQWVSSHVFSVPVLGIKVMASDIGIIGPPALLFIGLWNFFAARREHFTTARLLADVYQYYRGPARPGPGTKDFCRFVLYAVYAQNLFTVARTDRPIESLDQEDDERETPETMPSLVERARRFARSLQDPDWFSSLVRAGFNLLSYLPSLAILAIWGMRMITFVWVRSPFRQPPSIHSFFHTQPVLTMFMTVTSLLSFALTYLIANRILRFDVATRNVMIAFREWALQLAPSPPRQRAPGDVLYHGPGHFRAAWAIGAMLLFVALAVPAVIAPTLLPELASRAAWVVAALSWGALFVQQKYERYEVRTNEIKVTRWLRRPQSYSLVDFAVHASPDGRALMLVKQGGETVNLAIPWAQVLADTIEARRAVSHAA